MAEPMSGTPWSRWFAKLGGAASIKFGGGAGLELPDLTDTAIIQRNLARKQQLASAQGRAASFITGPRGLGGPSSEIARAFLRAKLMGVPYEPPGPPPTELPPKPRPPPIEREPRPRPPPRPPREPKLSLL